MRSLPAKVSREKPDGVFFGQIWREDLSRSSVNIATPIFEIASGVFVVPRPDVANLLDVIGPCIHVKNTVDAPWSIPLKSNIFVKWYWI